MYKEYSLVKSTLRNQDTILAEYINLHFLFLFADRMTRVNLSPNATICM